MIEKEQDYMTKMGMNDRTRDREEMVPLEHSNHESRI